MVEPMLNFYGYPQFWPLQEAIEAAKEVLNAMKKSPEGPCDGAGEWGYW